MKAVYLIIIFSLLAITVGCKSPSVDSEKNYRKLLLKEYDSGKIFRVDSLFLTKLVSNDTVHFIYADSIFSKKLMEDGEKFYSYSFTKLISNDSVILFDVPSPLTNSKVFTINQQKFKVLKYHYNLENSAGEETDYFYQQDYGLLVVYNEGCFSSLVYSMEYDSTSKVLVNSILQDTTGFYKDKPFPKEFDNHLDSLIDNDVDFIPDINLDSLDKLQKKKTP